MGTLLNINQFNRLSDLEFSVMHGPSFSFYESELYQKIFAEWKSFWEGHFEETKSTAKLYSDDLLRSTYILVLHRKQEPVAILLSSIWNLWNPVHLHSRYISQYPQAAKDEFEALNFKRVLSLEYLSIRPEWRYSASRLPLSEILLGLALKIFHYNSRIDGVISIARKAVAVQERMAGWGMREVVPMTLHNNPCVVTLCTREEYRFKNPNSEIDTMTNSFLLKQKQSGFSDFKFLEGSLNFNAA